MNELYRRTVRLTAVSAESGEQRSWTGLRVTFSVEKTDRKKPNKAEISVWNLSRDSRNFLQAGDVIVTLEAGYGEEPPIVFRGDVDSVETTQHGEDWQTRLTGRDGGSKYELAETFETFEPPLTSTELLNRLAKNIGLSYARLPRELPVITYENSWTFFGSTRDFISTIVDSLGATWSIQDGELVVVLEKQGSFEEAPFISPETGLVGSPEKLKRRNRPVGVSFKALLNGRIRPRGLVELSSAEFQGTYVVRKVAHSGDTESDEWYSEIEARI